MGFWFAFFLFVGTTVVSALLQKPPKDASPAGAGDFQVPTAEEGRPIPVVYGTCQLKGPNVVWWGDLRVDPIKKKSGGFLGIGAKKVTVGYKYFVGMLLALCHGEVELLGVRVGDKDVPYTSATIGGPEDFRRLTIDQPDLFGGDEKEGGVQGTVEFYRGLTTQNSNAYLTGRFGTTAPALRGLCYAVLLQTYVGTSQYIKNWAFTVKRIPLPAGMDTAKKDISGDANPAYIVLDLMTNAVYGLGIPSVRFDLASFQAAADALYTESFGMSVVLDSDNSADQVLGDIMRTIDAVLFTDPATGLWTLKLARKDYVVAALPEFTVDDLLDAPEFTRGSWSETLNEVKVEYIDRAGNYKTRVVQCQESANYATRGETASESFRFHGISNATLALKVAMRLLKTSSYPLAQVRIKVNRKAWQLRPGSPFRLTWEPPAGPAFTDMVLRVKAIRYGDLSEGQIEIEAVEDIFAVANTAYSDPGGTGWTEPISNPVAPAAQVLLEVPYGIVGEARWVAAMAARGDQTSFAGDIWVDEGAGYFRGNDLTILTPSGVLASPYSYRTAALDTVGFTIAAGAADMARLVGESTDTAGLNRGDNLAVFADTGEIVGWTTCTDNGDGTYTFTGNLRGVLDTVPTDHSAGARVWFMTEGAATTKEDAYTVDQTVTAKVLPKNARGTVAIGAVSGVSLATSSRAWKPNPPGNVKINALGYNAWPSTIVGDGALTWSHRNRISQGINAALVAQDTAGAFTPEGDYTVEVLVGGVVKQNYTGLTTTSQTYTAAQRVAGDADGTKTVQMRIKPINGSYQGTVRTTPAITMTGFGMTFGNYFGGIQG